MLVPEHPEQLHHNIQDDLGKSQCECMWMPRNTRPRLVDGTDHWWRGGSKLPFTGGASANHISGASSTVEVAEIQTEGQRL